MATTPIYIKTIILQAVISNLLLKLLGIQLELKKNYFRPKDLRASVWEINSILRLTVSTYKVKLVSNKLK